MSLIKQTFPTSGAPSGLDDYVNQNNLLKKLILNQKDPVPLKLNASSNGFEIPEGSIINLGGSMYVADSDTAVTYTFGIETGQDKYIKITTDGTGTVTAIELTIDDSFTWSNDNNCYQYSSFVFALEYKSSFDLDVVIDSFSYDTTYGSGFSTLYDIAWDGTNIIGVDGNSPDIIIQFNGFTNSVLSSFSSPGANPTGITVIGGNLISYSFTTNLIYIHSGITSTISSSFTAPTTGIIKLATDGTNLISFSDTLNTVYIHSGVTSTVSSSFTLSENASKIAIDQASGNLIAAGTSGSIWIYNGITNTLLNTYTFDTSGGALGGVEYFNTYITIAYQKTSGNIFWDFVQLDFSLGTLNKLLGDNDFTLPITS
jgi:hypothetical protein